MKRREFIHLLAALPLAPAVFGFMPPNNSKLVYPGKNRKLIYVPDEQGNTIPDFSNCGYMGGGMKLPDVPVRLEVAAGQDIQAAIDKVSKMPPDKRGFRGAIFLKRGVHKVGDTIRIHASGVVLRGEGQDENGTILVATQKKQHALIEINGQGFGKAVGTARRILDAYAPVGTHTLKLDSTKGLRVGDSIIVRRIGNKEWIHEIGMDRIVPRPTGGTKQWEPFNMDFERLVTKIDGDRITIDAPVVCAVEQRWGGGEVLAFETSERISQIGIEKLRGVSEFDKNVTAEYGDNKEKYFSDEQHGWDFISINSAENVWVKNITALHFGYSAVNIGKAKGVTVQDSKCLEMVSVITGGRRYSFNVDGQLNLVLRCEAESGRHDFVVGGRVPGPNAFVHCSASNTFASSEPHHRWSTGGLFDNVKAPLAIQDRGYYGSGHGWSGANYVAWNCEGPLVCQRPPTAQNWAIGHIGEKQPGAFKPREDGYWESLGRHVEPQSLYFQQLKDRLGNAAAKDIARSEYSAAQI
jgi:hypothetical protein